jgi:hypothetical protein
MFMKPSVATYNTVVIHQPDFLPYPGFFHRLLDADLFVVLDHVQFLHNNKSWHHRDLIKTPQGTAWLTVSVKKAPRDTAIKDIEVSNDVDWRSRHLNLLRHHYFKAPYFDEIYPYVKKLYRLPCRTLISFNIASIRMLMALFDMHIDMVFSSDLKPQAKGCDLLVDLLGKVGATRYLSGIGARDYFQAAPFDAAGIDVQWQQYTPPIYPQRYNGFIPNLSSIDMLFNCGIHHSRRLLRKQREEGKQS